MEDDKIPLSESGSRSNIVVQTREKFEFLIEDALNKKSGVRRSRRKSIKVNKSLDEAGRSSLSPSTSRRSSLQRDTSQPSFPGLKTLLAPLKIKSRRKSSVPQLVIDEPQAPPRVRKVSRSESAVIEIPEDGNRTSPAKSLTPQPSPYHEESSKEEQVPTSRQHSSSSKSRFKIPKKKNKNDKKQTEAIEMQSISPGRIVPETCLRDCLTVEIEGCCPLPKRSTPHMLRVHVVDTESSSQLATSQQINIPSSLTRGGYWHMDLHVVFGVALQLAIETPGTIIFLELFSPSTTSVLNTATPLPCYARLREERCIGWSFLKLKGHKNCNSKSRLQIYDPLPSFLPRHATNDSKQVYGWWCKGPWRKIEGCCWMEVTVTSTTPGGGSGIRDTSPLKDHQNHDNQEETQDQQDSNSAKMNEVAGSDLLPKDWIRRPGQLCKVPSKSTLSLTLIDCLALNFNYSGDHLACAARNNVLVFKVPSFSQRCRLSGHQGLVYSICWGLKNELFSASADCTVIQWDINSTAILMVLPHPTFVYCCQYLKISDEESEVITGCKDGILRIWKQTNQQQEWDLWQELEGHSGFVTSLSVSKHDKLASSDSEGVIILWNRNASDWSKNRTVSIPGLGTTSICSVIFHPGGSRLIVHARDSLVRSVDVATGALLLSYTGALTHKVQTGCCLSPCGTLVIAGSEDGSVTIWQCDTGQLVTTLLNSPEDSPCTAVAYHPQGHLLISAYYGPTAATVWTYDPDGLKIESSSEGLPSEVKVQGQIRLQDIIANLDKALNICTNK